MMSRKTSNINYLFSRHLLKSLFFFAFLFAVSCAENAHAGVDPKVLVEDESDAPAYEIVLNLPIDSLIKLISSKNDMSLLSEVHGHVTAVQLKRERLDFIRIENFSKLIEGLHSGERIALSKDSANKQLSVVFDRNKGDIQAISQEDLTLLEEGVAYLYYELFVAVSSFTALDVKNFSKGLLAEWKGEELQKKDSIYGFYQEYKNRFNLDLNSSFLKMNKARKEVVETNSGLQYEILAKADESRALRPNGTSKVTVHYHGILLDGTVFDSSFLRGETISFGLNQVIPGWTEGLQLMSNGDTYRFYIPYNLAYGERGNSSIPGFSLLIFDVKLFDFK